MGNLFKLIKNKDKNLDNLDSVLAWRLKLENVV
jgi:hypothetical protein